jgi:phosphoglycerate kinase
MAAADKAGSVIVLPTDVVVAKEFKPGAEATVVPVDAVPADQMILDIGPKSVEAVNAWIDKAATLVWNGPLGAFEVPPFDKATVSAARHAASRKGKVLSVAGGGETVSALHQAGAADGFSFISTAGGAFLEWLEGKALPGVEVLRIR